jgi:A/G-specific adenine glycosylase
MDTQLFQQIIYQHFQDNPRHLPWRTTTDPYQIMVSEIMLQQTQVERVQPKYEAFLARFPTIESLAQASLAEVLGQWQGLGYNRRGMMLQRAAETIVNQYAGTIPDDPVLLAQLPGIGPYTAGAITAFAFGHPTPVIETNIRSVFIHFFFPNVTAVNDREILSLVELTMDRNNIRDWYNALMDYGVMLKKTTPNPSRRSRSHSRQSPFRGSNREIRGEILRLLLATPGLTAGEIAQRSGKDEERVVTILTLLVSEGLLQKQAEVYLVGNGTEQAFPAG